MKSSPHPNGFSLTELLVTLALLASLLVLAQPLLGLVRNRTKTAQCLHHLRLSGTAVLAYAGDRGNRLTTLYGGGTDIGTWARALHQANYLPHKAVARCPTGPASHSLDSKTWDWSGFGLNMQTPPGRVETVGPDRVYHLTFTAISHPSQHLLLADSVTPDSAKPSQTFRLFVSRSAIHLRHDLHANVFFLDGHAENLDEGSVQALVNASKQAGRGAMYYLLGNL